MLSGGAPQCGCAAVESVFVKNSGDARARFARVLVHAGDAVTDLAARAARELDWHVNAARVTLFLVKPAAGSEHDFVTPTREEINAALAAEGLGEGPPLRSAGVTSGAWLVASVSDPPAPQGGGAGGGGVTLEAIRREGSCAGSSAGRPRRASRPPRSTRTRQPTVRVALRSAGGSMCRPRRPHWP